MDAFKSSLVSDHFGHKGECAPPESSPVWRLSWELFGYPPWATISQKLAGTNPKTGQAPYFLTGVCVFGASDVYLFVTALESHCGYGLALFNRVFNGQFLLR